MNVVSDEYFRTLELPIFEGRAFTASDLAGPPVCIVNQAFVEQRLQGGAAVGRSIQTWGSVDPAEQSRVCEIVGVATSAKRRADELEEPAQIFYPFSRIPFDDIFLVVRPVSGDAAVLAPQVRAAIARVDRESLVSVTNIATLETVAHEATARYRFRATLIAAFAGLALVLAALGLFGVLAYTVQRRWREYGVRMALGARPEAVVGLIARGAARLLIPGVLVGVGARARRGPAARRDAVRRAAVRRGDVHGCARRPRRDGGRVRRRPAFRATRIDPVGALRSE